MITKWIDGDDIVAGGGDGGCMVMAPMVAMLRAVVHLSSIS